MTDPIEDYRAMANMLAVLQARIKAFKARGVPHDTALYDAICYLLMREMVKIGRPQRPVVQSAPSFTKFDPTKFLAQEAAPDKIIDFPPPKKEDKQ